MKIHFSTDISIVNLYSTPEDIPSTKRLNAIARRAKSRYLLINLDSSPIFITSPQLQRIVDVMESLGISALYTDYILERPGEESEEIRLTDYQPGSVREGFDFGYAFVVDTSLMKLALSRVPEDYSYAGLYDLRLRLSEIDGGIFHLREPLYRHVIKEEKASRQTEAQFEYLMERRRKEQSDYEKAFTSYLKRIGAWLPPRKKPYEVDEKAFPVVASVIIPVRNRERTIGDAIESALSQVCDFQFNVLVVDNCSTDHTSEIVRKLSLNDERVVRIAPRHSLDGIGSCWNAAVNHRLCGAYAIQLDSDDLYKSPDVLQRIVNEFRRYKCAMIVGSYSLTDFELNEIAPGLIDHREWTESNGHNNLLRVNGIGAPRSFATAVLRSNPFPPVSYGEDYAVALKVSRNYYIGRIYESLYLCRRWAGNSDASLTRENQAKNDIYKDMLRTIELKSRINQNHPQR